MIRHWCEAVGDANPAYTGPDAIAPPTMLQVWTMSGLSGHAGRTQAYDELLALVDGAGCTSVVATDCEQECLRPLRPGDEVTFDAVIESVSDQKRTKLGTGYFVTTRMDVRVDGEAVGTHRFRILKYAPAGKSARAERARAEPATRRPRPVINQDNAGFWQGVARHLLLIQRCGDCGTPRFPWLPGCNACGSPEWDTFEASGAGTVYSYVVLHHPPFPAFDPPYAVGLIELAEGVRIVSRETDGGQALVVTSLERARDLPHPPAVVTAAAQGAGRGQEQMTSFYRDDLTGLPEMGVVARQLWRTSGMGPADIDVGHPVRPLHAVRADAAGGVRILRAGYGGGLRGRADAAAEHPRRAAR